MLTPDVCQYRVRWSHLDLITAVLLAVVDYL
jgi:hypothetical protein